MPTRYKYTVNRVLVDKREAYVQISLFKPTAMSVRIAQVHVNTAENTLNSFDIPDEANQGLGLSYALIALGVAHLRRGQAQTVIVPDCNELSSRPLVKCGFVESEVVAVQTKSKNIRRSTCTSDDPEGVEAVARAKLATRQIELVFHNPHTCVIL